MRKGDEYVTISGNQLGVLLIDYIINSRNRTGTMPENPGVLSSIVSTSMARVICEYNDVHFEDTFTGFKFMAERVASWEAAKSYNYIFAFEESYGYMVGDYVRDKDAVTASLIVAEMGAYYYNQGMTLLDAVNRLYEKYGFFAEKTVNLVMPGVDGLAAMRALMAKLREQPPMQILGTDVLRMRDYADGSVFVKDLGKVDKTPFWGSNVLYFELADLTNFIIRPSGTEPKIKVYILARGKNAEDCQAKVAKYTAYTQDLKEGNI